MEEEIKKEEFLGFDKALCDQLSKQAGEIIKELGREETMDYKMGLSTGYLQGAADAKRVVYGWLKLKGIIDEL